ncbi:hypothetical protein V6N12_062423 [Hibiscus sabdariffa]|uniref:Reverse transcriptase n=1 Tax=Hibiscus sabdariffa TaxID=183260 RepID=A0ABR2F8T5_9ROSI
MYNIPWFVGGDFNSFLNVEESSGCMVNITVMGIFKQFVQEVELVDLPMQGGSFTWSSNRKPPTLVCLDRFLLSLHILTAFSDVLQHLLDRCISNHNVVMLRKRVCNWSPRPFKFFSFLLEKGFVDVVVSNLHTIKSKRRGVGILGLLKESKNAIKQWSGNQNFDINKSISSLEGRIRDIECKVQ